MCLIFPITVVHPLITSVFPSPPYNYGARLDHTRSFPISPHDCSRHPSSSSLYTSGAVHDHPPAFATELYAIAWPRADGDASCPGGECGVAFEKRIRMPLSGKDKWWFSFDFGPIHFLQYSTEHAFHPGAWQLSPPLHASPVPLPLVQKNFGTISRFMRVILAQGPC